MEEIGWKMSFEDLLEMRVFISDEKEEWSNEIDFFEKQLLSITYLSKMECGSLLQDNEAEQLKIWVMHLSEDKKYVLDFIHKMYIMMLEKSLQISFLDYKLKEKEAD